MSTLYRAARRRRSFGGFGVAGAFGTRPTPAFNPNLADVPAAPTSAQYGVPEFVPPPDYPNPSHPGPAAPDPNYHPPAGSGGVPPTPGWDPNTDPIVAAVLAQNARDRAAAHASMTSGLEQLLLGFGDPSLASKILGGSDPVLGAISSDYKKGSTSTLAKLAKQYADTVTSNEDQLNKANLFYSGARVKRLSDLSYQNQARIGDATTAVNQAIQAQIDKFNAEKQAENDRWLSALDSAYGRWLDQQTKNPGGNPTSPNPKTPAGGGGSDGTAPGQGSYYPVGKPKAKKKPKPKYPSRGMPHL